MNCENKTDISSVSRESAAAESESFSAAPFVWVAATLTDSMLLVTSFVSDAAPVALVAISSVASFC
jgi:hypothetical protein